MSESHNALEMSDEDFLKMDPSAFEEEMGDPSGEEEPAGDEQREEAGEGDEEPGEEEEEDRGEPEEGDGDEEEEEDPKQGEEKDQDSDQDPEKDSSGDPEKTPETPSSDGSLTEGQLAEIGKRIMGEFKANGTTMKVKSAEDAIQLMQMGANYHKKMIGLKPSLKTLKLLENNGLLDPEKLNYLIDLSQKKPEAITKLLKESQIDPMTIDLETDTDYTPHKRTVSDTEILLDEVLDSISGNPSYDRTLTVLGDEWDDTSRKAIAENPEVIRTINAHMENGIYDQVASAIAYERSLGKLVGVSDLEAYQRVGAYMHENGLFKNATGSPASEGSRRQDSQPRDEASDRQAEERRKKKQAASPSRQRQAPVKEDDKYNPLAMSDEEFIKLNKLSL